MGFLESLLEWIGFGFGIPIGIVVGFLVFIYFDPTDVSKEVVINSVNEFDSSSIVDIMPNLPLWVMNPDYERVDWLNRVILDAWPYIDKAACGIITTTAEAIFAEYIGQYQIKSIDFERLTLGSLPPKIHGLKPQDSNENELVLDLALRWAGDADIALEVKLSSLRLAIQVVDIQISSATRIVLRPFVPSFPCFSSIAVSLMEKPMVDFGFRIMGCDIMSVPGVYHILQDIVARQVAKLYLWPQTLEIDILDSSLGATKKPVGILHVKVVRARNLLNMDFLSTSDPYVKLSLTGERLPSKKTTVKKNNLNPEWNETFKLTVKDPVSQVLQLKLYDWEKVGAHDYLGMQLVPLNTLVPYKKQDITLDLQNSMDPNDPHNKKPHGQIAFETTFVPFLEDSKKFSSSSGSSGNGSSRNGHESMSLSGTGLLLVRVVEAKDVEGKTSPSSPYATVLFRGDKRRTKTVKKTRNPYWNEEFQFVLDEAPVKDFIKIEVMSKRRRMGVMCKESLGYVEIHLADVVDNEHINEKYHLIDSRDGIIHLDIRWKVV
ncbi:synaptotagmin-3-like isoform X1 [Salvia splendens]|uniref:synaptotagmin-3-like isoform X1 n=1 Tax=Salvia splendens TaxID=180675 RepID=UPI001C25DE4A|nr:synaptotagmin-3-like isoform X1 [Salvia splendens]